MEKWATKWLNALYHALKIECNTQTYLSLMTGRKNQNPLAWRPYWKMNKEDTYYVDDPFKQNETMQEELDLGNEPQLASHQLTPMHLQMEHPKMDLELNIA